MKIKNIRICKKTCLLLISGVLQFTFTGCNNIENNDSVITSDIEVEDNNEPLAEVINVVEQKNDKKEEQEIIEYPDHTYGFMKEDAYLKKSDSKKSKNIIKIEKYQKVKLINKTDKWVYIKYSGKKGYIKRKNIKRIKEKFIDVDISEQKLKFYDENGEIIIKSDVITGKQMIEDSNTKEGYFHIYSRETNRYLKGEGYNEFVNYWMPFNGGQGLHDADRWRSNYGGEIYITNGSHGCVNLPNNTAKTIYDNSKVGTKVLVHK